MPRHAADAAGGRRAAVLGYLTVPVFLVPLVIYLTTLRGSGWARRHAAQAVNVWLTGLLYDLSAVIMGAMLALDSPPGRADRLRATGRGPVAGHAGVPGPRRPRGQARRGLRLPRLAVHAEWPAEGQH